MENQEIPYNKIRVGKMESRSAGHCTALSVRHLQFRYSKNGGNVWAAVDSTGVISLCYRLGLCLVFLFKDSDSLGYKNYFRVS